MKSLEEQDKLSKMNYYLDSEKTNRILSSNSENIFDLERKIPVSRCVINGHQKDFLEAFANVEINEMNDKIYIINNLRFKLCPILDFNIK